MYFHSIVLIIVLIKSGDNNLETWAFCRTKMGSVLRGPNPVHGLLRRGRGLHPPRWTVFEGQKNKNLTIRLNSVPFRDGFLNYIRLLVMQRWLSLYWVSAVQFVQSVRN